MKRVQDGGGLVMLGGYHSLGPGGYEGTPIGKILPVRLGSREVGQISDPFLPLLTPDGAASPIFANILGFFPTRRTEPKIAGLPLLNGCTKVEGLQPGATVLATHPTEGSDMPVLAIVPVGKGRAAVFTGDTTRNWQQGPRAMDQRIAVPAILGADGPLAGRPGRQRGEQGQHHRHRRQGLLRADDIVQLTAVVRDQKGEGAASAQVTAKVTGPGGRARQGHAFQRGGTGGHYGGTFEPREPGRYQIRSRPRWAKSVVHVDRRWWWRWAGPTWSSKSSTWTRRCSPASPAETGGRYMHISTADHLVDQLDRTQRKKRTVFRASRSTGRRLFWVLFVGVLTTEWLLRKRFQLR